MRTVTRPIRIDEKPGRKRVRIMRGRLITYDRVYYIHIYTHYIYTAMHTYKSYSSVCSSSRAL